MVILALKIALLIIGFVFAVTGGIGMSYWDEDDDSKPVVLMLCALITLGAGGFL